MEAVDERSYEAIRCGLNNHMGVIRHLFQERFLLLDSILQFSQRLVETRRILHGSSGQCSILHGFLGTQPGAFKDIIIYTSENISSRI